MARYMTEEIILASAERVIGTGTSSAYQKSKAERIGILVNVSAVLSGGVLDVDLETSHSASGPWFIVGTSIADVGVGSWSIWTSDNARYVRISYAVKTNKVTFQTILVCKNEA